MKKIIGLIYLVFVLVSCGEEKIVEVDDLIDDNIEVKIEENNKEEKNIIEEIKVLWETDYFYTDHITLYLVGWKLTDIIDIDTKNKILFDTFKSPILKNKSYSDIQMFEKYYLPKNKMYKINFKKYKQYPSLTLYVKIPYDNNLVEVLNYDNIETNSDDETLAELFIGNINKDKDIKRTWESNIKAEHDGFYKIVNN